MTFSLVNASATFQRLLDTCLEELQLNWFLIYLNDVIVFSKKLKEHLAWLRAIFQKLREVGLKLKPSKCEIIKKSLTYLGHTILEKGINTDDSKVKVIWEWPTLKTETKARSF